MLLYSNTFGAPGPSGEDRSNALTTECAIGFHARTPVGFTPLFHSSSSVCVCGGGGEDSQKNSIGNLSYPLRDGTEAGGVSSARVWSD